MPATTIERGSGSTSSPQAERFEVIRSQERLSEVWSQLHDHLFTPPSPPAIDFDSKTVVFYEYGIKPDGCHSVEVQGVERQGDGIFVEVVETVPAPACTCTFSLVRPFHLIEVGRFEGPASVCVRTTVRQCPG